MISDRTEDTRVIRPALTADVEEIAALHCRARATYYPDGLPDDGIDWAAAWRGAVERPDGRVLCVVEQGTITGIASFRPPEHGPVGTVKLYQFHVVPDRWRTGIGTALHAACAARWRADGRDAAVLDVHVDNLGAQAFYARQGWRPDPAHPPAEGDHHLFLRLPVPPRE
jgi:ribosomal protein S18 acetylase RimI-like enzyme